MPSDAVPCPENSAHAVDAAEAQHLQASRELMRGRFEAAASHLQVAAALRPGSADIQNDLGTALAQCGRLDEADEHFRRSLALDPRHLHAANNIGVQHQQRGQYREAEAVYAALIARAPAFPDPRQNLAVLYLATGRPAEAVQQCQEGLRFVGGHRGLRELLGQAHRTLGHFDEAREHYRQWLAEDPRDAHARHHLAALSTDDGAPAAASAEYVRETFDRFAPEFESKLAGLGYEAPRFIGQALFDILGSPNATLRIIDAGCGTGLCAPWLRLYAAKLIGVDLSGAMLARARASGMYDQLHEAELVAFLEEGHAPIDIVAAADTLCYFGNLSSFLRAAGDRMAMDGWLIFTVEALPDTATPPTWRLEHHGRYAHHRSYLHDILGANGFSVDRMSRHEFRREGRQAVWGWLVTAQRLPAG